VTLVDANLLLYAANRDAPEHEATTTWLTDQLNGPERTGLPWESLTAFVRLATHPRVLRRPIGGQQAWSFVEEWLAVPSVWIPTPTEAHADTLAGLIHKYRLTGNRIPDAHLAAIAIEHGLEVFSADTDFARFSEVRWRNPLDL
jgi:uncharacterized protein